MLWAALALAFCALLLGSLGGRAAAIVNGTEIPEGQRTYNAALINSAGNPFCTASIVGDSWALTARHCLDWAADHPHWVFRVGAGSPKASEMTAYDVVGWSRHEDVLWDIAVVEIDGVFDPSLERVALAPSDLTDQLTSGGSTSGVTQGWGRLGRDSVSPDHVQQTPTRIMTDAECRGHNSYYSDHHLAKLICGAYTGGASMCSGDSGGPLTIDRGGRTLQVGISAASDCDGTPGTYTNVSEHLDWIADKTRGQVTAGGGGGQPPAGSVTVYRDGSYTGISWTAPIGIHDFWTIAHSPVGNDQASSIQIPDGFTVKVCQHGDGSGTCRTFNTSVADLGDLDNEASHITITRTGDNNDGDGGGGQPPTGSVTVYRDNSYRGASWSIGIGTHPYASIVGSPVGNDQASSIQIPDGFTVKVCQHGDGSGTCRTFNTSVADLGDLDNEASHITVFRHVVAH